MSKILSAILCMAALCGASAHATTNLVQNGDFETATLQGWTSSGDPAGQYVGPDFTAVPGSLNQVFSESAYDGLGYIGQQIATVAHGVYTLEFDLQVQGDPVDAADTDARVSFNGALVFAEADTSHGWRHFTIAGLPGDGNPAWLSFGNRNYFAYNQLDNISLVQTGVSAVAEPSSVLMLMLGLCLVGATLKRRHQPFF